MKLQFRTKVAILTLSLRKHCNSYFLTSLCIPIFDNKKREKDYLAPSKDLKCNICLKPKEN